MCSLFFARTKGDLKNCVHFHVCSASKRHEILCDNVSGDKMHVWLLNLYIPWLLWRILSGDLSPKTFSHLIFSITVSSFQDTLQKICTICYTLKGHVLVIFTPSKWTPSAKQKRWYRILTSWGWFLFYSRNHSPLPVLSPSVHRYFPPCAWIQKQGSSAKALFPLSLG